MVIDGLEEISREDLLDVRALAQELAAEVWLSLAIPGERADGIPEPVAGVAEMVSVILALEPQDDGSVVLRALKDHDNDDLSALHVALDPRTLLLVRN